MMGCNFAVEQPTMYLQMQFIVFEQIINLFGSNVNFSPCDDVFLNAVCCRKKEVMWK